MVYAAFLVDFWPLCNLGLAFTFTLIYNHILSVNSLPKIQRQSKKDGLFLHLSGLFSGNVRHDYWLSFIKTNDGD